MTSPDLWAPYVKIVTPQVFLPFYVKDLVVHSEESQHQWAQLTVCYHIPSTMKPVLKELPAELWWKENRPVRLTYGPRRSVAKEFVGYVVSPEILSDSRGGTAPNVPGQMVDIRYTMLGVTKPLQTVVNRLWRNCTAPFIAKEIAESNGFAAVVGKHPRVFETRQQSESDFSFLRRMADEIGWRLAVDGTTLYFTDARSRLTSVVPSFRQNGQAGLQDTMQSFTAITGDLDPAGALRTQHMAVSLSSAGVVTPAVDSTTGGEVTRQSTQYVASSYAEAQAISSAAASRSVWWVSASASVDGDVSLMPGCPVSLSGTALTGQYTGQWMTRTVNHRISISLTDRRLSSYYVDLTLGRDQADKLTVLKDVALPRTQNVLANGRWISRKAQ